MPENLHNKALRAFKNIQNDNWKFVICFIVKIPIYLTAKKIIAAIDNGGILFGMKKEGIVPLSGNMLELEKTKDNSGYKKGRLYFLVTSKNKEKTIEKMFKILKELKISVC